MAQQKESMKVRFLYREGPNYQVVHATGARGAVTPQAGIKFDLYTEFPLAPLEEVRSLNQDGTLTDPIQAQDSESGIVDVVRQLQVGVSMSIADAESIAKWLQEKANEAKSAMQTIQSIKKETQA